MKTSVAWLQAKWEAVLVSFRVEKVVAAAVFADLVMRYGEDGRYYHNLQHLGNVLQTVEALSELVTDYTAVQLAAWFHDAIYHRQPLATSLSNEMQSAEFAAQTLQRMNVSTDTINLVHQLICATQLAALVPHDANFHVLLDADLAILAADREQYDQYAAAIRQEYAFVPDDAYRDGRCQILQSFLDRDRIFLTQPMFEQQEKAARLNIQREIEQLR